MASGHVNSINRPNTLPPTNAAFVRNIDPPARQIKWSRAQRDFRSFPHLGYHLDQTRTSESWRSVSRLRYTNVTV
jgi:hypothetical protein